MGIYLIQKMLLRLSHLIHNGECEKPIDRYDSAQRFIKQYGRKYKFDFERIFDAVDYSNEWELLKREQND